MNLGVFGFHSDLFSSAFVDSSNQFPVKRRQTAQSEPTEETFVDVKVKKNETTKIFELLTKTKTLFDQSESIDVRHSSRHSNGRTNVDASQHGHRRSMRENLFSTIRPSELFWLFFSDFDQLLDNEHTKLIQTQQYPSDAQFIWNDVKKNENLLFSSILILRQNRISDRIGTNQIFTKHSRNPRRNRHHATTSTKSRREIRNDRHQRT